MARKGAPRVLGTAMPHSSFLAPSIDIDNPSRVGIFKLSVWRRTRCNISIVTAPRHALFGGPDMHMKGDLQMPHFAFVLLCVKDSYSTASYAHYYASLIGVLLEWSSLIDAIRSRTLLGAHCTFAK